MNLAKNATGKLLGSDERPAEKASRNPALKTAGNGSKETITVTQLNSTDEGNNEKDIPKRRRKRTQTATVTQLNSAEEGNNEKDVPRRRKKRIQTATVTQLNSAEESNNEKGVLRRRKKRTRAELPTRTCEVTQQQGAEEDGRNLIPFTAPEKTALSGEFAEPEVKEREEEKTRHTPSLRTTPTQTIPSRKSTRKRSRERLRRAELNRENRESKAHSARHLRGYDSVGGESRGQSIGYTPGYASVGGESKGRSIGYTPGYASVPGESRGRSPGYTPAESRGRTPGYPSVGGESRGRSPGYTPAESRGHTPGYPSVGGESRGRSIGYTPGESRGRSLGYTPGYSSVGGENRHSVTPGYASVGDIKRKHKKHASDDYPNFYDTTEASERGHESLSEETVMSEEIEVYISDEFRDYVEKVTIGKLSRAGLGHNFSWSKLAYYCVVISYATSLDTIAMFNYVVAREGMNFLIIFLLCMYVVAFPLLYLELALGQYTHSSILTINNRIAPISFGLGVSALAAVFVSTVIDNDFLEIMGSMLSASFDIFTNELPYDNCVTGTCRPYCQSLSRSCKLIRNVLVKQTYADDFNPNRLTYSVLGDTCIRNQIKAWNEGFQENTITHMNFFNKLPVIHYSLWNFENFDTLQQNVWPHPVSMSVTLGSFCMMGIMLAYRRKLLEILAYIYMSLIFVVSVSIIITYVYISPPSYPVSHIFEKELNIDSAETWLTAIIMSFLCLRLGYGGMIFLGAQNTFHNDFLTDAMVITVLVSFIYVSQAMLHALVRDSFMLEALNGDYQAFFATLNFTNNFSLKSNRAGIKHLSLLMASFHSFGDLHAPMVMLFAVFGIFSSVISKTVRVEMIYTTIIDFIGFVPTWEAKTFAMFLICLVLGFLSLISYCPDCYMVELSLETIVLPNITLIIMLGELLVICGLYGTERFFNNVSTMIVGKAATFQIQMSAIDKFISFVAMLLWKAVIPVAIMFAVIAYLYSPTTNVENYDIIAHIVLLLPIPICALYKAVYFYLHKMNLWRLFAPDSELWGPRASAHRALAERNEKLL